MTVRKWIMATAALAIGLSAGAFAENQQWSKGRDDNRSVYTQRYSNYHDYTRDNKYRDQDRERNSGDRDMRNRDHRDRDLGRRDGDDRVRVD
jgi:hypothetical protein